MEGNTPESSPPPGLDEFIQQPSEPGAAASPQQLDSNAPPGLDEFVSPVANEEKYGGVREAYHALGTGFAEGAAGPLGDVALTEGLGRKPEDVRGEVEQHPLAHAAGVMGGLISTAGLGVGLGAVLPKIGSAVSGALGVAETAPIIAKIGSTAAAAAVENAAFQLSDEGSKLALNDPNQSIDSAAINVGAAGILGGALGAGLGVGSALWSAAKGSETAGVLKALVDKVGGFEQTIPDAVQTTLDKSGLDLAPELKGALAKDPKWQEMFNNLRQTDTSISGKKLQKAYHDFRSQASDAAIEAFGKTPEEIQSLGDLSKYESGKNIGDVLASEYHEQVSPLSKAFEDYKTRYGKTEIPGDAKTVTGETIPGVMSDAIDKISQMAVDQGWAASPSSDIMREVNRVVKELPLQKNIKNLGDYITQVGNNTSDFTNPALRRAGGMIKGVLKDTEAKVLQNVVGKSEGLEAAEAFNNARKAYAAQSELKDALNDRLHIRGSNTANFAKTLRETAQTDGESVLRRLSGTGDADLLNFLQQNYPKTAQALRDYHINDLLKSAADKAAPGLSINSEQLAKKIAGMSPELRNFIAPKEALEKIQAIDSVTKQFNKLPYNFSNTARTFDKMVEYVPSTVVGVLTALVTHNPAIGAVVGALTKTIGKEVPDAIKLSLLKFMGSSKPINSEAFHAVVDMMHNALKGEEALNKAAKNVFKQDVEVSKKPSEGQRLKLDNMLKKVQENPELLQNVGQKAAYYAPDHGIAASAQAVLISNFLNASRPEKEPQNPLDTKIPPTKAELAEYNNLLDLANNPLILLNKVKSGTVTPKELMAVKSMYPALYNRMSEKLSNEIAETKAKGKVIPYNTRMGLSLMLGQPMDSTMTPGAFQATQQANMPLNQPQMPQGASNPQGKGRPSSPALQKLPGAFKTPGQAAEERRATRR